jgi:hypothetical protein
VFARPDYQWVDRRVPLAWLTGRWRAFLDWLDRLADQHPAGFKILLVGLILVLGVLLVHIGYVLWRIVRPSARTGDAAPAGRAPLVVDARAHLARAAELALAGRYAEALGHRFLAVVLELEEVGAARFHRSKTPAEYVGEARLDPEGRATFAELVGQLYRHLFGAVPCDEAEYVAFGRAAQQVTRHVLSA